ncbi:DOPA-like domain-containing protein [Paraphysoderma sedebokerense]|nr:DOPA-like domain-containing protein [Paraphysoderma sedebokerense]
MSCCLNLNIFTTFKAILLPKSRMTATLSTAKFPEPITSYDVHVYWLPKSQKQFDEAMLLRENAMKKFPNLRYGTPQRNPVGPHPYSMFEIDLVTLEQYAMFVPWITLNHGNLSVLIHPHTGDEVKDHSRHALWLGERVPLDFAMLEEFQKMKDRGEV